MPATPAVLMGDVRCLGNKTNEVVRLVREEKEGKLKDITEQL